jgi:hypothetical protein
MSDETNEQKPNLRVLDFSKEKHIATDSNKMIADMFKGLADRALQGDIEDFVITFKSNSRGIESMIGASDGINKFDFVGYIGMLEVLKQRLLGIMSQRMYAYAYEGEPAKNEDKDEQPEPEKP